MSDNPDARTAVLSKIRHALGGAASNDAQIAADYKGIPRNYKRRGTLDRAALLDLFTHRLLEYDAGVARCTPDRISAEVERLLTERGRKKIAIPEGLQQSWLPSKFEFNHATGLEAYALDALDGVLTGCTVAIAETGSIVLQNAPGQGPRILTLVPDYHLCVVFADQVVETVPESFDRINATGDLPTTFFSGPSATADIEMTRIKGVHGPRFLDVLVVT